MRNVRTSPITLLFSIFLAIVLAVPQTPVAQANDKGKAWNEDSRAYSEGWPWPPLPNWWNGTDSWYTDQKITNLRLGFWLACRTEWAMNDCIDQVNVYDSKGVLLGSMTFVKNPLFDPFEAKQYWVQTREQGDGPLLDNSLGWVEGKNYPGTYEGHWLLPTGVSTASGNQKAIVSVQRMHSGVQALIQSMSDNDVLEPLPEGITFEVILKSKELKNRAQWIHSNGKDPQVLFPSGDYVVIKGITAKLPWPPLDGNVCKAGNEVKAIRDAVFMGVNIFITGPKSSTMATPGEVVIGTNGWWCFGGLYWDTQKRNLVANVGAAHFYSDGSVVDGWLEVKIKGARVRDWWGISPEEATGYARVELVYEGGVSKIATVSATYNKQFDWIDLRAYGFTYSNPQIKISFQNPTPISTPNPIANPTPAPVATPAPAMTSTPKVIAQPKRKTITCIKGKTTRKVTAINPKCPSGFSIKR